MTSFKPTDSEPELPDERADLAGPACVLTFNANDPSGAGGLAADIASIASVGAHPIPVVTGAYLRDTAEVQDHYPFDGDAVAQQARGILEDVTVQVIKVGFLGSAEAASAVAEIAADYADVPVVAYMPNLAWWEEAHADPYLDAFKELVLPQTTVLVGSHGALWRWLLPDWSGSRSPGAREIAKAAADMGVPYTLITGIAQPEHHVDNVLASPQGILYSRNFERFDATFSGAGDTLSATLAALVAAGTDLAEAAKEALAYLDRCLGAGFRPGMGHAVPDRMFWAQPDDPGDSDDESSASSESDTMNLPPHDTRH